MSVKLTIEFPNQEALEGFATWLCECGEQDYWNFYNEYHPGECPVVSFDYHPVINPNIPEDEEARYGAFLADNTIRTELTETENE